VLARVWLLLRRPLQRGVREIRGDIVLDSSAFVVPDTDPAEFDGEPLRPYNVRPSALLMNFSSVSYTFVPDEVAAVARETLTCLPCAVHREMSAWERPGALVQWRIRDAPAR
jgi:D-alanyl-D-alanine carboxypeptidase/D-alanyl-D-alanine-endopeptidase (penicillin-binding protein 4)